MLNLRISIVTDKRRLRSQGDWTDLRAPAFRDIANKAIDYGALALLGLLTLGLGQPSSLGRNEC
jgi:hypothetical protein